MNSYPHEGLTGVTTADLTWMSGVWKGHRGEQVIEEHWSGLDGGTLMGMFRWLKDGGVRFYEFLTLALEGDHVMLRIKHFHPGLASWEAQEEATEFRLVQLQGQEAVFLQTNKPGPWMVYRRESAERLVAYFDDGEKKITEDAMFIYYRQSE